MVTYSHWLGDSNFSAQFMVKNVICFSDIFQRKNGEILKAFSPLFWFEVKNLKES
jgi:hypothetical protein